MGGMGSTLVRQVRRMPTRRPSADKRPRHGDPGGSARLAATTRTARDAPADTRCGHAPGLHARLASTEMCVATGVHPARHQAGRHVVPLDQPRRLLASAACQPDIMGVLLPQGTTRPRRRRPRAPGTPFRRAHPRESQQCTPQGEAAAGDRCGAKKLADGGCCAPPPGRLAPSRQRQSLPA